MVYCPFFYNPGGIQGKAGCLKEGCTFWIAEVERCSIQVLARQALGLKQGDGSGVALTAAPQQ